MANASLRQFHAKFVTFYFTKRVKNKINKTETQAVKLYSTPVLSSQREESSLRVLHETLAMHQTKSKITFTRTLQSNGIINRRNDQHTHKRRAVSLFVFNHSQCFDASKKHKKAYTYKPRAAQSDKYIALCLMPPKSGHIA